MRVFNVVYDQLDVWKQKQGRALAVADLASLLFKAESVLLLCREESEARNQRFSMVHMSFAKKEAALRERADEAEMTAEHLRQV